MCSADPCARRVHLSDDLFLKLAKSIGRKFGNILLIIQHIASIEKAFCLEKSRFHVAADRSVEHRGKFPMLSDFPVSLYEGFFGTLNTFPELFFSFDKIQFRWCLRLLILYHKATEQHLNYSMNFSAQNISSYNYWERWNNSKCRTSASTKQVRKIALPLKEQYS